MKKIFAIALALVMVLSMASAFAFVGTCGKYEWTCDTAKCGVAKAEVVQFVANNTIDMYEESTCAAVVVGRALNYGVKVTFDKDVNPQWFYHKNTKLVFETSNVQGARKTELVLSDVAGTKGPADVSGKTFWLRANGANFDLVSTWEPACVFSAIALTTRANVTAKVGYDFNGVTVNPSNLDYFKNPDNLSTEWIDYGDFKVRVHKNYSSAIDYAITVKKGGDVYTVWVVNGVAKYVSETNAGDKAPAGLAAAQGAAAADLATATTNLQTAQTNYDNAMAGLGTKADALKTAQANFDAADKALKDAQAELLAVNTEIAAIEIRNGVAAGALIPNTSDDFVRWSELTAKRTQLTAQIGTSGTPGLINDLAVAQTALAAANTAVNNYKHRANNVAGANVNWTVAQWKDELDTMQAAYNQAAATSGALATAPIAFYNKFDGTSFSGVKGNLNPATGTISGTPTSTNNCSTLANLLQIINIKLGDCVKGSTIKAIFGWEDSASSKATWNKNALAIVNAECQVAIPKTGDVSVVAYAVMALVAAAGAMGLKK